MGTHGEAAAGARRGGPQVGPAGAVRREVSDVSLTSSVGLQAVRGRLAASVGAAKAVRQRRRTPPAPLPESVLSQREASPAGPQGSGSTKAAAPQRSMGLQRSGSTRSTKRTARSRSMTPEVVALPSGSGYKFGRPPTLETNDLENLTQSQRRALRHIRQMVRPLHEAARARLAERVEKLGFRERDLDTTLGWIRDEAPILVHLDLSKVAKQLTEDTHYRSQFETRSSQGTLDADRRSGWEDDLFGCAYEDAEPSERCKYGVLNATNDPKGVRACKQYGASYLQLRRTRLRTTFSAEDSAAMSAESLATVDYYAHVLEQYTDEELFATMKVGTRTVRGADSRILGRYKEAQIHGPVSLRDHVECIVADPSLRRSEDAVSAVELLGAAHSVPVLWMEDGASSLQPSVEVSGSGKGLSASAADQLPDAPEGPDYDHEEEEDDDGDLPQRSNQYRMSNSAEFADEQKPTTPTTMRTTLPAYDDDLRALTLLADDDELLAERLETMKSLRCEARPRRAASQWQQVHSFLERVLDNATPTPGGVLAKRAGLLAGFGCCGPRVRLRGRGRPVH